MAKASTLKEQLAEAHSDNERLLQELQTARHEIAALNREAPSDNVQQERKRIVRLINRCMLRDGTRFVDTGVGRNLLRQIAEERGDQ